MDDAKANLDILVEGLKPDHKLSLAPNGEIALQIAARTPPDLVLLDIMMPGLVKARFPRNEFRLIA